MTAGQGVPLVDTMVRLLGYADDVSVTEEGDYDGVSRLEMRVNCTSKGSSDDADMKMNVEKTKVLHVRAQEKVSKTTE